MVRGLERRKIFQDEQDRESFINRLETALEQTEAQCHAFTLTGLDPAQEYFVAIKSRDEAGNISLISNVVNFTTYDNLSPVTITVMDAYKSILLTWPAAPGGTYRLYRMGPMGTEYTLIAVGLTVGRYADLDLPGGEYHYRLQAVSFLNEEGAVSEATGESETTSSAYSRDTDGDGIADWWEIKYGLDPLNAADGTADPDGDGLTNYQEFLRDSDPFDPTNSSATDNWITNQFECDPNGNVTKRIDDNGKITMYSYRPGLDRLDTITFADNTKNVFTHDAVGNILTAKDNNGAIVTNAFDNLNRLVTKSVDTAAVKTTFTCDEDASVKVENYAVQAGTVGGFVERFGYDGLSRMTSAENVTSKVTWQYDLGSRVTSQVVTHKTDTAEVAFTIGTQTYDALGNRMSFTASSDRGTPDHHLRPDRQQSAPDQPDLRRQRPDRRLHLFFRRPGRHQDLHQPRLYPDPDL